MKARRKLRHEDIETASGVPLRSVKALLSGERAVSPARLDALCRGLGCTVAQILALAASADDEQSAAV